jgi:hypothetical protein
MSSGPVGGVAGWPLSSDESSPMSGWPGGRVAHVFRRGGADDRSPPGGPCLQTKVARCPDGRVAHVFRRGGADDRSPMEVPHAGPRGDSARSPTKWAAIGAIYARAGLACIGQSRTCLRNRARARRLGIRCIRHRSNPRAVRDRIGGNAGASPRGAVDVGPGSAQCSGRSPGGKARPACLPRQSPRSPIPPAQPRGAILDPLSTHA